MPRRETAADRKRQRAVFDAVVRARGGSYVQYPQLSKLDGHFERDGKMVAIVEVKCRTNAHDKYETYMIDKAKVLAGEEASRKAGVPFLIFVKFTDGIYWMRAAADGRTVKYQTRNGGRWDRDDPYDRDVCAYISIKHFRRLR